MQIKHLAVMQQMQKNPVPLYVLIGQDTFLLEEACLSIRSVLKKNHDCEEKTLTIQSTDDWQQVVEEANSYSLFSETVLIKVNYDKKTLDATGKKVLTEYLKATNPRCFIILCAPNVPAKQILWLSNHEQAVVVVAYPLNTDAMKNWIAAQLKSRSLGYTPELPALIHHYTQGNMLASAQVIEKLGLTHAPNTQLSHPQVLEQLSDQCDHSLFELVETCLLGQAAKAIQIIRQASSNKSEATLVLWILTQEVRVPLQLLSLTQHNVDFRTACAQLKIWPQRYTLYQAALRRVNSALLTKQLRFCSKIDEQIKSSQSSQAWSSLESLALNLSV